VLAAIAATLRKNSATIIEANKKDLAAGEQKGLTAALLDRLALNPERIEGMAKGVEVVAHLLILSESSVGNNAAQRS
jgi:glutamate-5-semialdehyde dehydrogenase